MRRPLPFLLLSVFGLIACQTQDPSGPSDDGLDPPELKGVAGDPNPSQMALARAIPGFGGYFLDRDGRPTVYLRDAAQRGRAERALARALAVRGVAAADLKVLRGRYDYADLDRWYRHVRSSVFLVQGIVYGDVDEGRNQLRFGVTDPIAATVLQGILAMSGIPAGGFRIESHPAYRPLATLRDRVRPLEGGLQINFFATPAGIPGPSLICTLGFNADAGGVRSFITNSHCTNNEGGTALPTDYYQHLRSGGAADHIGVEVDDPQWQLLLNADCPPPLQCRYSDAARVAYDPGADAPLGGIAMIDAPSTSLADTTHDIVGQFVITGERADPLLGEVVQKVGRTTGWTLGPVTGTCVDVLALGTTHMRLCQSTVSALVDGGDSGSPVFARTGTGNDVTLLGILWGGNTDATAPEFVFSPLSGIERELGDLTVH